MSAAIVESPTQQAALTPSPVPSANDARAIERSQIDSSASTPVLTFFFFGLAWLLVATVFEFISSYKLQNPEFLANWDVLTYGRVTPAARVCFTYGWCSLAGMGVTTWLMARLSRTP